jgi:hypothetical protein
VRFPVGIRATTAQEIPLAPKRAPSFEPDGGKQSVRLSGIPAYQLQHFAATFGSAALVGSHPEMLPQAKE